MARLFAYTPLFIQVSASLANAPPTIRVRASLEVSVNFEQDPYVHKYPEHAETRPWTILSDFHRVTLSKHLSHCWHLDISRPEPGHLGAPDVILTL